MKKVSIYVILTVYLLISIFPFLWLVTTSFKSANQVFSPQFFGSFLPVLDNYVAILTHGDFLDRLLNSFISSLCTVLITIPIGSLAGYAFARLHFKRKDNVFFMILTTRMAPPVAFGVPFYLLLVNAQLIDTRIGLIAVYVFMNLALCIWLTRGYFEEIPIELEEAAYVDGCRNISSFMLITLPLAVGGIITTAVLIFAFAWNEFFFASILTKNNAATYTVHLTTYFGSQRIEWGQLAAASTIASLVPIILAMLARKHIVRGFSLGSVKTTK